MIALSGAEALRRAARAASPDQQSNVKAGAKFDSLSAFATPVENPSAHLQRDYTVDLDS